MASVWFLVNLLRARWEVVGGQDERRDRGVSLVEYALLVSLIALVCVAAISYFGSQTGGSLTDSGNSIVG